MNNPNNNFYLPNQPEYDKKFWNYAFGKESSEALRKAGKRISGGYVLPSVSENKFMDALKEESLFRNIGTYVYSHSGPS